MNTSHVTSELDLYILYNRKVEMCNRIDFAKCTIESIYDAVCALDSSMIYRRKGI